MKLSKVAYLFLSNYAVLPLKILRYIEESELHPFHNTSDLSKIKIITEFKKLGKIPRFSIRNFPQKLQNVRTLLEDDIFETIELDIIKWEEQGIQVLPYFDKSYPFKLQMINNPPKTLFIIGSSRFNHSKSISIIGTRKPTPYGAQMAESIGLEFTKCGFTIVNGFANGVDTLAMKGCLKAGGKVIGVLGSGLLKPYPKENVKLFHDIINKEKGFFLSEHLPNVPVKKSTLATRNRISSALSIGNVFIEGSTKSGIRYQLKYSKEQKKPIVVLQPKDDSPNAAIPNQIIKEEKHCFIVESIDDIPLIAKKLIEINNKKENLNSINKQKKLSDFK